MGRAPVEYPMVDLNSFASSGNRKSWIDVTDPLWTNLGPGWHDVESDRAAPGIRYRWSQGEASVYLWNPHPRGRLTLQVFAGGPPRRATTVLQLGLRGQRLEDCEIRSHGWEDLTLDYCAPVGPLEIRVRTRDTWRPDDALGNGDRRELGLAFRRFELKPHGSLSLQPIPISVIIPTFNRVGKLSAVLKALAAQTLDRQQFEVVVVNDGSTDATSAWMREFAARSPLNLKYYEQPHQLQSAARNLGIAMSTNPIVLFLGDDIVPQPTLLEEHLRCHRANGNCPNIAVLGHIDWLETLRATPFMRYVGRYGAQFGYALIKEHVPISFKCFYTSNVSVHREMLSRLDHCFDQDFATYGWEDIELGYRLEKAGMRLLYHPAAVAYHDHHLRVDEFCRRQFTTGQSSRVFIKKHPELEPMLGRAEGMKSWIGAGATWELIKEVVNFLDQRLRIRLPWFCYHALLARYYAAGVLSIPCSHKLTVAAATHSQELRRAA
jgi:GT2 family glycosyltransferase